MKTFTLELNQEELAIIERLVLAAGKAPATGPQGMMASLQALQILARAKPDETNIVPMKEQANG